MTHRLIPFLIASLISQLHAEKKPNVLLLLVDDLKPALGCYGDTAAITPNIDKLARTALRFDLAFCNQAVCAPSRYNLMLGSRSTSTGLYHLNHSLRKKLPNAITLPQYFRKYGYKAESLGKIYHIGHGNTGDPQSWSVPHFKDYVVEYVLPESNDGQTSREEAYFNNSRGNKPIHEFPRGAAWEAPDVEDDAYADGRVADETIKRLQAAAANSDQPFFIACGFARPHLPFTAPKRYWDMHDPDKLPMPEFESIPEGTPKFAIKRRGEICNYKPVPEHDDITDDKLKRQLIHGYYTSTTYMDAQLGKVLDELKRLKLDENTIVVLWGDHGFHLGDHLSWTKHSNFEQANRIPIIIRAPGVTKPGTSTAQIAETVDIFPTIAELAGLPTPEVPQPIDGESLVPVLKDPAARVSDHAYHVFPMAKFGRAIRTERYRMVEWTNREGKELEYELYDYQTDPLETKNLAKENPKIMKDLQAILAKHPAAKPW